MEVVAVGTRVQALIDTLGIKKAEFARKLNLSQPFVSELCSGTKNPSDRTIADICRKYNVSESWLRDGLGSMFVEITRDDQIAAFIDSAMKGEDANFKRRLLSVLSRLGEDEWALLERRLREVLGEHTDAPAVSSKPPQDTKPKTIPVPTVRRRQGFTEVTVFDQPAAAGLGNPVDIPPSHTEQYPSDYVPSKTNFGVLISGTSMEPKIPDGSTVFVQATPALDNGEIGIFVLDGKSYCKQLKKDEETVILHSINPQFEDIDIPPFSELRTLGRVLGGFDPRTKDII